MLTLHCSAASFPVLPSTPIVTKLIGVPLRWKSALRVCMQQRSLIAVSSITSPLFDLFYVHLLRFVSYIRLKKNYVKIPICLFPSLFFSALKRSRRNLTWTAICLYIRGSVRTNADYAPNPTRQGTPLSARVCICACMCLSVFLSV